MIRVTPFHPSHFGAICPRVPAEHREVTPEYLEALAHEPSITIWCDGAPAVVGGVAGGVEVWAAFDAERAREHKFAVLAAVRRYLDSFGFLYANARTCEEKFLRHLGFVRRGSTHRSGQVLSHFERVVV